MEREYKGWRIEVHSYQSEGGKWRPNIRVWTATGGAVHDQNLVAPTQRLFDTEQESDEYGCQEALVWIDSGRF
jgi:hypothetical protein